MQTLREIIKIGITREEYGNIKFFTATDYQEVVDSALRVTKKGKICLLSPAAASFGMFKNYKERGDLFKKEVLKIHPVK